MTAIDNNYKYFKDNFDKICKNHIGEFVVIKDCEVLGYYKSVATALKDMQNRNMESGTYIIQECMNNIYDNMAIYSSRVFA